MRLKRFLNPARYHLMRAYAVFCNIWELFQIWCVDITLDIFSFAITRMSVAEIIWNAKTFAILNTKVQYDQKMKDFHWKYYDNKLFWPTKRCLANFLSKLKVTFFIMTKCFFFFTAFDFFNKQKTEQDTGRLLDFQSQGTFVTEFRLWHLVCPIVQYEPLCSPDWFHLLLTILLCFVPSHSLCLFPRPRSSAPVFY